MREKRVKEMTCLIVEHEITLVFVLYKWSVHSSLILFTTVFLK